MNTNTPTHTHSHIFSNELREKWKINMQGEEENKQTNEQNLSGK